MTKNSSMNMREIAARAGVSSATVSRVINGSPLVKEKTAERIRTILNEVNFIPNPVATTLKYGRSKTYGLIIPDIRNPFFSECLAEFEDLLVESDYEILVTNVTSPSKLVTSVRRMLMRQVDGAFCLASEFDTKDIEPLFLHRVPIVTLDRRAVQTGCSDVSTDFEAGFLDAVKHLKDLGHKRIGYIGGTEGMRTTAVRQKAFELALQQTGLRYYPNLVRDGDFRITGGEQATLALMQERMRPTAIIAANDLSAYGTIRALHALGLSVPTDISIIGLDDLLLSEVLQPPLTTIRIPRRRLAEVSLKALNYTKEDVDRRGRKFTIPAELIVRASTGRAKISS